MLTYNIKLIRLFNILLSTSLSLQFVCIAVPSYAMIPEKQPLNSEDKDQHQNPDDQEHDCTICNETLINSDDSISLITCKHQFHKHCIDAWMATASQANHLRCPNCRKPIFAHGPALAHAPAPLLPAAAPLVFPPIHQEDEVFTSAQGNIFRGISDHDLSSHQLLQAFGPGARRMPNNSFILSDIIRDPQGNPRSIPKTEAAAYCASLGARLPTAAEYTYLRSQLGGSLDSAAGYSPQDNIIPNIRSVFWTSTEVPNTYSAHSENDTYVFFGTLGRLIYDRFHEGHVRCVISPAPAQ